ncbi:hypothetical protein MFIFM68171_10546 [Madurella fahalii]|uniref:Uncharacterized protein n=1 Tax=Madurella fahalii TaxID=1157608 RepID=A0ABQ0GRG5_9PEZI
MAATVKGLLSQHSTNYVKSTEYKTWTDKAIIADFETPLLPDYDDDPVRWVQPAFPPNKRSWRLETEEDCTDWFKVEVSNIVLAAWTDYPAIFQVSQVKAFSDSSRSESVDVFYTFTYLNCKVPIVIGEWKRNLIRPREWMESTLSNAQQKLAKELRGYVDKYQCLQIFCFDGEWLLMLQFRAKSQR